MPKNQVITDIETLKGLVGTTGNRFLQKYLVPFLIANLITIASGMAMAVKNYYLFIETVNTVKSLQVDIKVHDREIQSSKIVETNHDARITNLEKNTK